MFVCFYHHSPVPETHVPETHLVLFACLHFASPSDMPRTTLKRAQPTLELSGDDLEASLRALRRAKKEARAPAVMGVEGTEHQQALERPGHQASEPQGPEHPEGVAGADGATAVASVEGAIGEEDELRWAYVGDRNAFHGEQVAPRDARVHDDVFGGALLRGAAAGRLLLLIDGEVVSRWRTAGHVFVPPMPAGEAGEEQVSETEAESEAPASEGDERGVQMVEATHVVVGEADAGGVQMVEATEVVVGEADEGGVQMVVATEVTPTGDDAPPTTAASPPELVLYSVAKAAGGRRAVLHVMDASKDLHGLSSRAVTHCVWVANVPPALLGTVHAGANRACCALRNALDPSKAAQGNNGVNMKVYLCMNPSGKAVTLKSVLDEGTLASYLTARRG